LKYFYAHHFSIYRSVSFIFLILFDYWVTDDPWPNYLYAMWILFAVQTFFW
jgi:hypothetical protein